MVDQAAQDGNRVSRNPAGRETWGYLLDALLEAGVPALIVLITLLYAPYFSDYMIPKTAALHGMVALLLGIWLVKNALQGRLQLERSPLYLPFLGYLAIALLALAFAHNMRQGGEVLLTQAWMLIFFVLVFNSFRDPNAASRVLWTVVCVSLVVSLLGVLQYCGIHLIPLPKAYGNLPVSTLGNTNFVAHYLEVAILLAVGLLMAHRQRGVRILLAVSLVAASSHMVLTKNRGGWLATGMGLLVLFLLREKQPGKQVDWKSAIVLGAVLIALLSPAVELVLDNVRVRNGESLYGRLEEIAEQTVNRALSSFEAGEFTISQRRIIWTDTLDLIGDHFWLGVGPGNYELFLPAHRNVARHQEWKEVMGERRQVAYRAHNEYLEVFAESGVFGLGTWLWMMGTLLWIGYGFVKRQTGATRGITGSCLAALAATLVHCLFSFNLQDPTAVAHFWLIGGLLMAISQEGARAERGDPGVYLLDLSLGRFLKPLTAVLAALIIIGGGYLGLCILMGDYYYFRGLQKNEVGHPKRAVLAFQEAISWRSYDFRYHHMLGMMYLKIGGNWEAERALARSVELHPNNAPALRLLGKALYLLNRGEEAAGILRQALQLEPLEFDTYQWLALAYRRQGAHDMAIDTWKQALVFDPEDAILLNSLAVEHAQAGELETAVGLLQQAARMDPREAQIRGNLGSIYLAMDRLAQAEPLLLQAIEMEPAKLEWQLRLVQLYLRQNRLRLAKKQLAEVLEKDPANREARQLAQRIHQLEIE